MPPLLSGVPLSLLGGGAATRADIGWNGGGGEPGSRHPQVTQQEMPRSPGPDLFHAGVTKDYLALLRSLQRLGLSAELLNFPAESLNPCADFDGRHSGPLDQ